MGIFSGYQIAVELTSYVPLKKKQELRKLITANDGIISFIVTKKCKLLVTSNDEERAKDSFKCQTALKFNIPVVESRYVFDCVETGHLVDTDPYVLLGNTKHHLLASGVIPAPQGRNSAAKSAKKTGFINLNSVKVWNLCDKNGPSFPEDSYKVARSIQLINSDKKLFFVAEIHVASSADQFKYRTFTHSGTLTSHYQDKEPDVDFGKACRYSNSADECLQIYSRICDLQTEAPNSFTKTREYLGKNIGSKKFQQMQLELLMSTTGLDKEVRELVEYIWKEAVGELQDIIAVPIKSIKTEQVAKAESVLLELKRLLGVDAKNDEIQKLSDEFFTHLAHNVLHQTPINTKHLISKKQELCQLIHDVISVSEGTNWSQRCPSEAKYKALRCHIKHLKADSPAYSHINQHILGSQKGKSDVEVLSVFEISRSIEESVFNEKMGSKCLLFHSSLAHNFVGILSRGLLLPKVIVDDCGGSRTDVGFLGSGIYFADDASTSAKYSKPSKCKGSRLMLINEVALGKCLDLFKHQTELSVAPAEYDSVHGVRATNDVKSDFKDDEYAIYDTNQQRLRYLIEFKLKDDVLKALEIDKKDNIAADEGNVSGKETADSVELNDVQNISDPLSKVKAGLVSDSSAEIPLTAVHVKARLIDLAAQVIVFQHYENKSNRPIEAKYVFPLDEAAAVCGFEAYINDKHIVGEVKEKETAHREYREAISQGHGAYLMDQDEETPEVFTVSVGNLPPWCNVMIKITYVSELQMEGENIFFCIPSCVAPWKKSAGLETVTQGELETVKVTENQIETSIQVAIEMPFQIREVNCTTHRIRLKKTDTKAVVEMQKNQPIDQGFQLLISLAEIHVPRMWVEQLPDDPDSRACMLTFYPEFEATISDNYEVIFLLDLSNSMKGDSLLEAKKILLLLLLHLPESCFFNVIVFGTDYVELFPCSRVKNPANVQLAEKFVKSQDATMDSTDVVRLLSSLYLLCPDDGFRNLFLISDGHISNEKVTLVAARLNCRHSRLFTFGVGSIANHHVLRSLASSGCGHYEYFNSKMKSRWERKIRNQLSKAAQPSLSSIEVNWHNFNNMGSPVQAPAEIMALFNGCRQVVYGFVPDCTQATLKAVIDNQEVSTMVSTADLNITTGKILHQLTARAIIQDWTDGLLAEERIEHEIVKRNRKNYIIDLSKKFSIITQFTSFVAVEKREEGEVMNASQNFNDLVQKNSMDILDYMKWDDIKFRVCVKTSDQQDLLIDVDPNETFGQLKARVSEITSKSVVLFHSQDGLPAVEEDCVWDHQMEKDAVIYAREDDTKRGLSYSSENVDKVLQQGEALAEVKFRDYDRPFAKLNVRYFSLRDHDEGEYDEEECELCDDTPEGSATECIDRLEEVYFCDDGDSLIEKDDDDFYHEKSLTAESSSSRLFSAQQSLPCSLLSERFNISQVCHGLASEHVVKMASQSMYTCDGSEGVEEEEEREERTGEDEYMDFGLFDDNVCLAFPSFHPPPPSPPLSAVSPSALEFLDARALQLSTECHQFALKDGEEDRELVLCEDSDLQLLSSIPKPKASKLGKKQLFSSLDLGVSAERPETSAVAADYDVLTELDDIQRNRRNKISSLEHSESLRVRERKKSKKKEKSSGLWTLDSMVEGFSAQTEPEVELEMEVAMHPAAAPVEETSLLAAKEAGGAVSFGAGLGFGGSAPVKDAPSQIAPQWMLCASAPPPPPPPPPAFFSAGPQSVSDISQQPAQLHAMFGIEDAGETSSFGLAFEPRGSIPVGAALQSAPVKMLHGAPPPPLMRGFGSPFSFGSPYRSQFDSTGPAPVQTSLFGTEREKVAVAQPSAQPLGFGLLGSTSISYMPPQPALFQASGSSFGRASKPTEYTSFSDAISRPASVPAPQAFASPPKSFSPSSSSLGLESVSAGSASVSDMPPQPAQVHQGASFGFKDTIERPSFGFACSSRESATVPQPVLTLQESASTQMPQLRVGSTKFLETSAAPSQPRQQASSCALPPPQPPCGFAVGSLGMFSASDQLAPQQPMPLRAMESSPLLAKSLASEDALPRRNALPDFRPPHPCGGFAVGSLGLFSASDEFAPQLSMPLGAVESAPGWLASAGAASTQPLLPRVAADSVPESNVSREWLSTPWTATRKATNAETALLEESDRANESPPSAGLSSLCSTPRPPALQAMSVDEPRVQKNLPCEDKVSESQPEELQRHMFARKSRCFTRSSALFSSSVRQRPRRVKLHTELPLTVGIGTLGVIMTPVFTRSTKLPATRVMYLTTCFDYQAYVRVKVYRGEHELTAHNTMLGELELTGLESKQQGQTKIEATFEINEHGALKVKIISQDTGCSSEATILAIEVDLSEEAIEAMIRSVAETKPVEPMDLTTMKANASNWDVCLYEERQSNLAGDSSLSNLNISTGKVMWTEEKWRKLSSLHHKCNLESDGVFWDLDDELGSLLCVDMKKFNQILIENGLKSLGNQAASDVKRLLANFLVLYSSRDSHFLLDCSRPKVFLNLATPGMKFKGVPDEISFLLLNAANFCKKTDENHPLIYWRMNLGRSWAEAASNLLGAAGVPRNLTGLG